MKVLLFSNDGCSSCKTWKPTFEKLMKEYKLEYQVIDNYDPNNRDLTIKYEIQGIPDTIFVDDEGEKIGHVLGNMIEDLAKKQIEYYQGKCKKE